MTKILLITFVTCGFMNFSQARKIIVDNKASVAKVALKNVIKKIKVYGMACPLCQSKAEKKFKNIKTVNSVNVDMEKMLITLKLSPGTDLSEDKIKPIVKSLGLTFVGIVK